MIKHNGTPRRESGLTNPATISEALAQFRSTISGLRGTLSEKPSYANQHNLVKQSGTIMRDYTKQVVQEDIIPGVIGMTIPELDALVERQDAVLALLNTASAACDAASINILGLQAEADNLNTLSGDLNGWLATDNEKTTLIRNLTSQIQEALSNLEVQKNRKVKTGSVLEIETSAGLLNPLLSTTDLVSVASAISDLDSAFGNLLALAASATAKSGFITDSVAIAATVDALSPQPKRRIERYNASVQASNAVAPAVKASASSYAAAVSTFNNAADALDTLLATFDLQSTDADLQVNKKVDKTTVEALEVLVFLLDGAVDDLIAHRANLETLEDSLQAITLRVNDRTTNLRIDILAIATALDDSLAILSLSDAPGTPTQSVVTPLIQSVFADMAQMTSNLS